MTDLGLRKKIGKFLILKAIPLCNNEYEFNLVKNLNFKNISRADFDLLNNIIYKNIEGSQVEIKIINKSIFKFEQKKKLLLEEKQSYLSKELF